MIRAAWRLLRPTPSASSPPDSSARAAAGGLLRSAALLPGLLLLGFAAGAQAQTASLTLDPTEIEYHSLHGATITLIPKNASFFAAGTGGGADDPSTPAGVARHARLISYVDSRDLVEDGEKIPSSAVRLSAAGLANITLSGAPSGLTIASGRLLARSAGDDHGFPEGTHRSAEITLAYSGSAITADDPVTVTVDGDVLSRRNAQRESGSGPGNLSADFTVGGPQPAAVTLSPDSLALTELGASSAVEKTYTVVLDSDPVADVTVTVMNGDGTAAEVDTDAGADGNQDTLTFTAGGNGLGSGAGNGNWRVPREVTVRALNDADGAGESFSIAHAATAASGPYDGIVIGSVAVTTTDAGHGVVVSESALSVAGDDETAEYAVVLKSRPTGNVVISATSDDTAKATVSPGTLTFGVSDWNTPKTFTVTGKGAGSANVSHAVQSSADTTNYPTSTTVSGVAVTVTGPRPVVSVAAVGFAFIEGSRGLSFDVTATPAPAAPLTVRLRVTATGAAASPAPDGVGDVTVTVPTTGSVRHTVNVHSDTVDEPDGEVTAEVLAGPGYRVAANPDHIDSLMLVDNDAGVMVSPTSLTLEELGAASEVEKTYTVVLDMDPGADVTVTATSGDTSAAQVRTGGGSFASTATLTFTQGNSGNWSTAQTVTVRALNDADGDSESFSITHSATAVGGTGPYHGITIDPVAVTVTDAGHGVVVSKSGVSVAANDETATWTVVLKSQPSGSVVISATSGATANATVSPGTLTFGASDWDTPKTFTVTGKGEGSTSITHAVQSSADATNYPTTTTISGVSVTVTADARPSVQITGGPLSEWEHRTGASIPVELSAARSVATTVELEQVPGVATATAGADFAAGPWSVTIPAGQTTANVAVAFTDDTALEMDEVFNVRIRESSLPAGVRAGTAGTVRVTILDNEYTLCFDRNSFAVNEHAGEVDITLTMSRAIPDPVEVWFDYADRTAVSGTDYDEVWASSSDATTIAANERALTLTVPVHPDLASTGNKQFDVTARPSEVPDGQLVCSVSVIITSTGLVVTESGGDTTVSEDGTTTTDTYTIALESRPDSDVTVTVTAGAGAEVNRAGGTAGSTQTLTFSASGANIWSTPQTVTVTGVPDSVDNPGGGRDLVIAHAAASTDPNYTISGAGSVGVRVTDDDPTTVTLSAAAGGMEEGQTKELTITLGRGLVDGEVLTVPLTFGGTATRGTDYTMTGTSVTGVQYNNLGSGNASVVFTGPDSGATATTATITLSASADSTAETTPETVDIGLGTITDTGLTGAGGVSETDSLAAFNISDPVLDGNVRVSTSALSLTELGAANAVERTYTISLGSDLVILDGGGGPPTDVTITVTNGDSTAVEVDTDPGTVGSQNTLTFTAGGDGSGTGANGNWAQRQTVTVRALNDGDAVGESFNITHTATAASGPYDGIAIDPVTVMVADAGHGAVVSRRGVSVTDDDDTAAWTVALKSRPAGNVAITATSGDTARAEVDTDAGMAGNQNTLTFTPGNWNTPQTVTVTGKGQGSTSISHAVSSSGDTARYPTSTAIPGVAVTVLDGNAPPTVTLVLTSDAIDEQGPRNRSNVKAVLSRPFASDVVLTVSAAAVPPAASSDFSLSNSTSLAIVAGETESVGTVTIAAVDNDRAEDHKAVTVSATVSRNPDPGVADPDPVTLRILDNDIAGVDFGTPPPDGVTISPASLALTESGAFNAVEKAYKVALDTDPGADVRITVTNGDATAVEVDANPRTSALENELIFTSEHWRKVQTVTVRALDDADGANESFNLTHRATVADTDNPYHGISVGSVAVTVTDSGPGVAVSKNSVSVTDDDDTATYTVVLKSEPSGNVVISVTSAASATATVSPATLTFGASDWNTPQAVTVTGKGAGSTSISHAVQSSADAANYPTSLTIPAVSVTVSAAAQQVLDLSFSGSSGNEGTAATLRIAATGGSGSITVAGGTSLLAFSGEGIASSDYSFTASSNFSLTGGPPPAATAAINLADDSADEPNETLEVGWQNLPSGFRAGTTATILIVDNDPTTVTLGGGGTVTEDGANSADVTVTLSRNLVAGETVTVPLAVTGAGIAAGDYTIVRAPGSSLNRGVTLDTDSPHSAAQPAVVFTGHGTDTVQVATLRITAGDDDTDEGASEELAVGFGSGSRAVTSNLDRASGTGTGGTTTSGTATVTITDDDGAGLAITETDGGTAVSEDGSTVTDTYTVALATEPTHGVTVTVTAGAGAQVNVSGGMWGASATLTFATASWSTAQTVTVRGVADSVDNPGGGRDVTIGHAANSTDPSYTIASAGSIDARVTDDDPTAVALAGAAGDIEEGQTKELTITLGRGLVDGEVLTVPLTFGGTATRGTDYTMAGTAATGVEYNNLDGGNATVVFTGPDSGATATTAAITLSAASDGTAESTAETVDIGLGTVTETGLGSFGGTENTDSLAAFGISDPPPGAGVTVSTVSLALTELGSSSTMEKTYTVVLDTDPGANVTITATNGDATAVEVDTDSGTTGNQNTLTFTAGGDGSGSGAGNGNWAVAQTVTVRALNDLDGMNESFSITHAATAASGAYNGISIDPVAVTTADAGHGVVVSKSSLSVAENDGTDTYTVVLKSRPSGNVVISATSGATARATVSPGTLTFGTSDWNTPKTFTVTGKGAGSTTISHAVDSSADNTNYPTSLTIPGVSVTVTADSRQVLDLSFSQAEQFENSSVTLTVTATGGSGSVTVAGGTALLTFSGDGIASSDYSFNTSSNLVLSGGPPPSSNIGISLANDNVDEPNETLVVGLQNLPAGYRAGTTASVTIVDRTPTTVTLAGGGTVMEDGSNTADVTVTLSRNLVAGETVTVPLAVTGAGIAAGDYTITPAPGSSLNRGVTLDTSNPHSAAQPAVVFTGHGTNTVQVATLRVTAVQDNTDEGASEALAVGFGSGNRAVMSNLDRRGASTGTTGTTTAGTATVTITDDDTSVLPVLSVALPSVEGVTRNTAGQQVFVEPGAGTDDPEVSFDLTLAPAPSADFAACIRVTETGGDRVAAADEGVKAVTVPDTGSLVHTVQWTDTAADDRDSVVTVAAVAPGTAGCSAASGTYTVSSTDASDSALVRDDDPTTVALTSSDTSMTEGDASNTATLTFTLGRQLYADEAVVVPFTLATTTGARLPGDATPDFAVTAAGTRVSIANANTATPSLTFTGHGSDTVRTATVTLTPVANRDDGDTAREEITATLAADSVLGSTSGSGTTVGGGAMRHGTDFAADLTLEDDEAPPGSVIFSVSELRLLENGSVTYTVRLNQEPTALVTAGVTPVGGDRGAVTAVSTAFFWPGTGSQTSWNSQQTITVTGVDEPGTHRNRATTIRYSLSSTDPAFNGRTFDLPVEVGDAPEVEAWEGWNRADGSRGDDATLSRPHTVESTPGIWPRRDFFPGGPLDYVVRLSNRPEPGGTVTVNVSRSNGGVQLGLTRNGPWRTSLAVTFGDGYAGGAGSPNIDACNNSHDWTRGGEAHDGTAATSWECWRKIWVRPLFWDGGAACTDLTHTASGGGVRSRTIETIRAHNPHYYRDGNRRCAILTPNTEPAALNAAAIQVPDTQVSNLVLEKTDSTSASASWDAVEHATGYEVSWDALDGDGQPVASGVHAGVTGTTETIEHDAPGAASLEVTVAPEHVDGNGDTQVSADLAATATLDLGTPQSAQGDSLQAGAASCDLGTLRADIAGHVKEQPETSDHVKRWKRVLAAFDGKAGGMTAAEARTHAGRGWTRWDPVVVALDCLEKAALPVVTVAGGAGVTEGSPAAFTVTATPAPSVPLTVKVTVGQGGDYAASGQTGARNVTVPTGGSATVQVATANDTADEPDGSVTATVEAGAGYTVGGAATATVTVADDDDPPANAHAGLIAQVREWRNDPRYVADKAHTDRWDRVLKAFGEPVADESLAPMTAAEAQGHADRGWSRWVEVAKALREIEGAQGAVGEGDGTETPDPVADPVVPELGLVAGDAVDEGGDAVFTVHADPAPEADLTVAFTVAQEGDWLSAPEPASRTLTLAAGKASAALTIATADDGADEADGSVRVTLDAGTGYTLADGGAAGTVAVRDNDTPAVGIAAGAAVTEGSPATFTLTANPAPHADLTVTLAVTQEGDHAAQGQTGARQATIPAGGSVAVEVATADDGADEADGRIAATVQAGSGYTVADPPDDAASVAVADDDEPVIGIAAGDGMADGVTEGGDAVFTLTAAPAPHADLEVTVAVADDGKADFLDADDEGERRVVIPAGKATAEVRLGTAGDSADEPDGSVTATLAAGSGYAVAAPPDDTATVAVADDDAAAAPQGPGLSVNDVEVKEGPYRRVEFTVTLSEAVEKYVSFYYRVRESDPVSAKRGVDFWASTGKTFAGMRPGQTEYRIRAAMVIDDSHDEDPETFEIVLSDANGAAIADGLGVATIVNNDPMPAAWLSRFGRTVAQQALDGISDRMASERTPGVTGTLAGHMDLGSLSGSFSSSESGDPDNSDIGDGNSLVAGNSHGWSMKEDSYSWSTEEMTLREAVTGSSFTATGREDATGGSLSFWGRGSGSSFDGREGTFTLDGDATTAMLGADYARDGWLLGLALLQSDGEGGYADSGTGPRPASQSCTEGMEGMEGMEGIPCDGAVRMGDGAVESTLTAAVPYGSLRVSDRIGLWGAFGHGTGEVFLKPHIVTTGDTGDSLKPDTVTAGDTLASDITWTMASAGMRGDLLRRRGGKGPALALTADALWARTESDRTKELAGSDSDATRLRLGLEGSWKLALSGGGHLTPKLELGIRHDGGDAETGSGIELGAGVSWSSPATGIRLDLSGRTLVSHDDDDLEDRGFSADLSFDPDGNTRRGPSFSLRQELGGRSEGGLDALFAAGPLEDRAGSGDGESRWTLEGAWGFPAFSGRYTGSPHAGMGISGDTRDWSVGWRLAPESGSAPDLSFGVRATRRENTDAVPEHVFGFEASLRW